jgi:3-dehydroquinate synthase
VELNELEVADFGSGPVGQRDAVAGGDIGVGRGLVEAAETAGGQQDGFGGDADFAVVAFVEGNGSDDFAVVKEELRDRGKAGEADAGEGGCLASKRAGDLAAGRVAVCVQDAAAGVRAFAGEGEAGTFAVELGPPGDQFLDGARAFLDKRVDGLRVAEAVAGGDGVLLVEGDLVVVAEGGGDAALGVFRGGLLELILGEDKDAAEGGKLDSGAEAGDTCADDEEISGDSPWYNGLMPSFFVRAPGAEYECVVARGALGELGRRVPAKAGKLFVVTTADVWGLYGERFLGTLDGRPCQTLFFPGGEQNKRMASVERLAEQMVEAGADRSSLVIAFGGGIVGDLGGFLAAIFMRGVPVIQVPTTLLAQVDAAIGGKTGANLVAGKNLVGAFHQPLAVLVDPDLLATLPEREYRAGLYEVVKCGIIASSKLFERMSSDSGRVIAMDPDVVEEIVAESVRIKAEVVTADEKEGGLRRILNFGHTLGHALEAETKYQRLLHGEAVAFGMRAATHLGRLAGTVSNDEAARMIEAVAAYGPIPKLDGIRAENLVGRLGSDKKTIQGKVHFVLPEAVGRVVIRSGVDPELVLEAARTALAEL